MLRSMKRNRAKLWQTSLHWTILIQSALMLSSLLTWSQKKIKTTAKLIKDCRTFFGEVSETAPEVHVIPLDDNSDLVADTNLRDYESIPFKTDIQEYFQNEVLRFAPDAWMDREKDKIGCEFPISKLFYEYQPLRSVEDILADIRALEEDEEQELSSLLND